MLGFSEVQASSPWGSDLYAYLYLRSTSLRKREGAYIWDERVEHKEKTPSPENDENGGS